MLDENGYPTDEALYKIETWNDKDGHYLSLMDYVKDVWYMPEWGWQELDQKADGLVEFHISTGGWSGNEDIIDALYKNSLFWTICWESMKRGGHYEFRVKKG